MPVFASACIASIYSQQNGSISGKIFCIERGVKQGDVISPLLFNAGLEHALRKWKFRVRQCGWDVGADECLTNVRYADDLIICAKSEAKLVLMLETLIEELSLVGLNLNSTKTKILTTENSQCSNFAEVKGDMVEILHGTDQHKYLGKKMSGDLKTRAAIDVAHCIQVAWMKFHEHRGTLLNRHVSLKMRLKFFDAVITPTVLYGLTTCPLTTAQLSHLDVVWRRMLRSIVGRVPVLDGDWHLAMTQMNQKLAAAERIYPLKSWTEKLLIGQFRFAAHIACKEGQWPAIVCSWNPCQNWTGNFVFKPHRRKGRPQIRWDDRLKAFAHHTFHSPWLLAARNVQQWLSHEQFFVQFCRNNGD